MKDQDNNEKNKIAHKCFLIIHKTVIQYVLIKTAICLSTGLFSSELVHEIHISLH